MNLPADFVERTRRLMGEKECEALCAALCGEAPVSIRMNAAKWSGKPLDAAPVSWCKEGWYLAARPAFTFDPLFHAGCYYVQEASSMFVEQVFRQYVDSPVTVLDLCAAPGGKSTLARAVLSEGSLLVANEVVRPRSQVLAENLIKWGHPSVVVTNNNPADFAALGPAFDVILADVPCSGEGMFRKDEGAVAEWSVDNVDVCWQRQRRILHDIWGCLKPGGLLVYSTCTFNREENEDNVAWISRELGAEPLSVQVDADWMIEGNLVESGLPVYRFLPHRVKGEGFFLAALRKTGEDTCLPAFKPGKKKRPTDKKQAVPFPKSLREWVKQDEEYVFTVGDGKAKAFPARHNDFYTSLQSALHVLHGGIMLAEQKGKDWIPAHPLAMSTALSPDAFPVVELEYEQAVAYLRKEAIALDASAPKGYVLLAYRNRMLGFAKNVGNRANNLYPQEWRIRSGYLPEDFKPVL